MVNEMASLDKNEAWDLVVFLAGRKPIGSKWVFKNKMNSEGKEEKYKDWLVAKGYSHVPGICFGDIFSLVTKLASIKLLLSVVVSFDLEAEQMDVKIIFLHGDLEEEIYMKKPEGFVAKGQKELVYIKTRKKNWTVVKQFFRYLRGTIDYGMCYQERLGLDIALDIHGFVDVDLARDLDQRRSMRGYVFNLFGGVVSWMRKRQSTVALSTKKVEYMASTHASKEVFWLHRLCSSVGLVQRAIRIECDSQSAIFLAKNPAYHSKTKNIDVQYHFVRDMIEEKKVLLVNVDTLKNVAYALTKSMSIEKFSWCREIMGIIGMDQ
eukprot:PITA_22017